MFDEDAFEFGSNWCPVCDKAIEVIPLVSPPLVLPGEDSNGGAGVAGGLSTSSKSKKGLGPRRKSTNKIHHPHVHHNRSHSKSQLSLHTLAPSTAINSLPSPNPSEQDPPILPASKTLPFTPPSSLYCSEDCRRTDEMRSRLAFAHLGPSFPSKRAAASGKSVTMIDPRRYSNDSNSSSSEAGPSSHRLSFSYSNPQNQASQQPHASSSTYRTSSSYSHPSPPPFPTLEFSRRNSSSRGPMTEGGYPYRPSLVGRNTSEDVRGLRRSKGSGDSLNEMGEADDKSGRGQMSKTSSNRSSLRFMTPLSTAPSPTLSPAYSPGRLKRPPNLLRHHTDQPGRTSPRFSDLVLEDRKRSAELGLGLSGIPPLASPEISGGTESDPGRFGRVQNPDEGRIEVGSPPARKPSRTSSSASLALMGSSIGKIFAGAASLDRPGWGAPRRSESTTSLSGMVAVGRILPSTALPTANSLSADISSMPPPNLPNTLRKPELHRIPSATSILRPPSSASSASNSSFAPSHFSSHPSNISTAGSSDHNPHSSTHNDTSRSPTGLTDMSSSAGSGSYGDKVDRGRIAGRGRGLKGLMMTPSASSGGDSSAGDRSNPSVGTAGTSTTERSRSRSSEGRSDVSRRSSELDQRGREDQKTPTQSLRDYNGTGVTRKGSRLDLAGSEFEEVRAAVEGGVDRKISVEDRNRTLKRRSKQARALSSPSTDVRPTRLDLLLSSSAIPSPILGRHAYSLQQIYPHPLPANATVVNPALDHLRSESRDRNPNLSTKSRNWSWDQLHVPTYPTLDLEKVRREKALKNGNPGAEVVQVKEKKKLFYFDDGGD